ncbi:MAG: tail fiber domain-containing protein [Aeromonas popoffii]|uniref:tail fiber domain-containing protein n=1 Tax=Aeromonas popoffii TaxID=70856 RepID=UPI003F2EA8FD
MELTPPVAYRMSLTAAEVEALLLSIYTKIPADTIRTSLASPDDLTIPTTKAVADAIAVINADLDQLGDLALLDSIDLGSSVVVGVLPISKGGTAGSTVEQAQQNLGIVAESAIQDMIDASIPAIQSVDLGSSQATGVLPMSKGGTGATGSSQARANLQVWSSAQSEVLALDTFAVLKRSYAEAGYVLVTGSFEEGGVVNTVFEVLLYKADGHAYGWAGTFPVGGKVVTPGSTPTTAGGVGPGLWLDRASATLRGHLSAADGASLIGISAGRTQADKNAEWVSVTDAPYNVKFDNTTDNTAGLNLAFQSGKKIWIPHPGAGNYALVNGPIYFDDNVEVQGPGKWVEVIRASSTFPQNINVISPLKLSQGSNIPTKNFAFRDFLVNSNGWVRSIGVADSCSGISLLACEDYIVERVTSKNSPKWNFKTGPFNQYADLGHLGYYTSPNRKGKLIDCHSEDYLDGDGFIFEGTEGLHVLGCTHAISNYAKVLQTYTKTHTGFQVIEGSKHVVLEECFVEGNNTQITAYGVGSHINRPATYDVLVKDSDAHGVNRLFAAWSDPASDVPFTDPRWAFREVRAENCKLISPTVDATLPTLPARVVDVQYVKDSHSKNVGVVFTGEPGESPVALINFGSAIDSSVDGFTATGVVPIPANAYGIDRNCGWIRTSDTGSIGIEVKNVSLDNIGYVNRVVHDSANGAVIKVDGISVAALPADGQEKIGVVSKALKQDLKRISGPSGFVKYKVGRFFTAYPYKDLSIRTEDASSPDTILGGLNIRSETNAGVQPAAGILFDRQFVSAANNNGKGCMSFRTSASAQGSLSATAYDEDSGLYIPMYTVTYVAANTPKKAIAPVVHGDMNMGQASAAWLNGYFVNAPQTVSDARFKSDVREMTEAEVAAGVEIIKTIGFWSWLSERGDRTHSGTTVQKVISIMESHDLHPFDYSFVCHDEWDDRYMTVFEYDDLGNQIEGSETDVLIQEAGDIYSFKVQELTLYLMACLAQKLLL